jgi:glycosyltransferase involved in cell wall biosynthesis
VNILLFTNMWPSADDPFGTFVAAQADDLRRAGATVSVVSFDARRDKTQYLRAALRLRRAARALRPDLVHAHYGLSGLVAVLWPSGPILTTFHGSDAYIGWQRRLSRVAARRSTPVCVSREVASLVGRPDAAIVPMGVDTDLFRPLPRAEARDRLGLEQGRAHVLFPAARGNPVKRYGLFRAAVDRLDVVPLEFSGFDRDAAALLLNAVDAVLVTSAHEGSPLTVREALACGTPVVSVPVGDVPDTVRDLPGCAIVEPDPARLADAVRAAVGSRPPAETLRARALESSRERVAERLLALYGDVIRSARSGAGRPS